MRLLHRRHDHARPGAAGAQQPADRRGAARPHGAQSLSLRHPSAHPARRAPCRHGDGRRRAQRSGAHAVIGLSRRRLLGNGALVVAFSLSRRATAQDPGKKPALPGDLEKFPMLDSWIRIAADGHITVFTGKAELGQGLKTALIQIAADELAVPAASIELITADTARAPDEGITAGSRSMSDSGTAILNAAANVRLLLAETAAWRLLTDVDKVELRDDAAHAPSGESLSYGELAAMLSLHIAAKPDVARRDQ